MKEGKEMRQCRNKCGKEISDDLQFCSTECATQYKEKLESKNKAKPIAKAQDNNGSKYAGVFWIKGEGMNRRFHNIEIMEGLIKSGLSYQEIFKRARKNFTSEKINEYYDIAQDEVNNGIDGNES